MRLRILLPFVAVFGLAGLAGTPRARADVGPDPKADPKATQVETCTLELQCTDGEKCRAFHGEVEADCAAPLLAKGYTQKCLTLGAMGAIYCPKDTVGPKKKGACQKSSVIGRDASADASWMALGVVMLAVAALRRARSPQTPTR